MTCSWYDKCKRNKTHVDVFYFLHGSFLLSTTLKDVVFNGGYIQ